MELKTCRGTGGQEATNGVGGAGKGTIETIANLFVVVFALPLPPLAPFLLLNINSSCNYHLFILCEGNLGAPLLPRGPKTLKVTTKETKIMCLSWKLSTWVSCELFCNQQEV